MNLTLENLSMRYRLFTTRLPAYRMDRIFPLYTVSVVHNSTTGVPYGLTFSHLYGIDCTQLDRRRTVWIELFSSIRYRLYTTQLSVYRMNCIFPLYTVSVVHNSTAGVPYGLTFPHLYGISCTQLDRRRTVWIDNIEYIWLKLGTKKVAT
jgi:hypothetical protein